MILCCCTMLRNVKLSQDLKFDTRNNMIALQDRYCGRFLFDILLYFYRFLNQAVMMIIITVTFVMIIKSISEQLPVHTITITKKQWSPLIFNMATIFTKEVKDVHLEHSSGHTPARLKTLSTSSFSQLVVKKSLEGKGFICGAPRLAVGLVVQSGTRMMKSCTM